MILIYFQFSLPFPLFSQHIYNRNISAFFHSFLVEISIYYKIVTLSSIFIKSYRMYSQILFFYYSQKISWSLSIWIDLLNVKSGMVMTISDMFFPNSSSIFSSWKCFCTFLTGFVIDSVLSQKSWTASHKITNWTSKNSLFVFFFQFFSMRPIIIRGKNLISEQYSILQLLVPIFSRHVSWRHLFWIMHPTN